MAEIARIADDSDVLIGSCDQLQNSDSVVLRSIVNKYVFVAIPPQGHHSRPYPFVNFAYVLFFVVARRDDGDGFHKFYVD